MTKSQLDDDDAEKVLFTGWIFENVTAISEVQLTGKNAFLRAAPSAGAAPGGMSHIFMTSIVRAWGVQCALSTEVAFIYIQQNVLRVSYR